MSADRAMVAGRANTLDVEAVRRDFPALHQEVHGHPLVYLDNGATSQKPRQVLAAIQDHPVPVVSGGEVVGLLRGSDILKWLMLNEPLTRLDT